MGMVLRIILTFIFVVGFSFIVFLSFFSQPSYFTLPEIGEDIFVTSQEKNLGEQGIYKKNLSFFNRIYSSSDDVELTSSGSSTYFTIKTGQKYFTSFRNTSENYILEGEGYTIQQEGIGEIFIDTLTTPGKVFIIPINLPIELSLKDTKTGEEYTKIFLYPHMYLEFQPSRGNFLKNADAIRVETVYQLGYLSEDIKNIGDNTFLGKYIDGEKSFFSSVFLDLLEQSSIVEQQLTELRSYQVGRLPGYETIQKYIHLFVNDEKKKVFYKNLVLSHVIDLLSGEKFDEEKVQSTNKNLEILRSIDESSYNDVQDFIEYFTGLVFSSYQKESLIPKISFASLKNPQFDYDSWYFPFYSFSLFGVYDSEGLYEVLLSQKFLQSLNLYIDFHESSENYRKMRFQYFSYFLEKQVQFLLNQRNKEKNILLLTNTLENYISVSELSYNGSTVEKVTLLYIYNEILKKIDDFLRYNAFMLERNEVNLLVLHPDHILSAQEMQAFQKQIERIMRIFEKDNDLLDSNNTRDASIQNDMSLAYENITEYMTALENYESYLSEYDISKKGLLDLSIYGTNDGIIISQQEAIKYLSQFVGVSLSSVQIEVKDQYYYHISSLYIAGKSFSFDLFPLESYKIQNIVIDELKLNFAYKLGVIAMSWEEKIKTASKDEKERYDFSRFFLVTFFSSSDENIEEYIVQDTPGNEDKTEIVFKRDKLLGPKGEFTSLKDVLLLEYNDISIQKNGILYDIFLKDVDFSFPIQRNMELKNIKGKLESEYVLNQTDHYFSKLSLKVYEDRQGDEKVFRMGGIPLLLSGKVHISEFGSVVKEILDNYESVNELYTILQDTYGNIPISLQYTLYNKKLNVGFDFAGKSYKILLNGNRVDAIYEGTKKILSNSTTIPEVKPYLP